MYQIKSDRVPGLKPKAFKTGGKNFFYVRIYLDGTPRELDAVELVKYTLDPTFFEPVRVSTSRSTNFEINIWTYGFFATSAYVIMRDGTSTTVPGKVEFLVFPGEKLMDDAPGDAAAS
jgi:hypothetical protein